MGDSSLQSKPLKPIPAAKVEQLWEIDTPDLQTMLLKPSMIPGWNIPSQNELPRARHQG